MNRVGKALIPRLYLVNTALLATHEIDSAYWHEWTLFRLPGGIQVFLIANLILLLVVLYGFVRVARLERGTKSFSYLLAAMGLFAVGFHSIFLVLGHPEFRAPVSIALLVGILLVSISQILVVAGTRIRTADRAAA